MRNTLKALLFVTTFSPALISIGAARWMAGAPFIDVAYYVFGGAAGSLCVLIIMSAVKWHSEILPFQAKKLESGDSLILGVWATYIMPFIGKASDITVMTVLILAGFAYLIFWYTDSHLPSPLMRILGFRFYKAESASGMVYTLITKRTILDPSEVRKVKVISSSMLLEVVDEPVRSHS